MPRRIVQVRVNIPHGFRNNVNNNNTDNQYALARNQLYRIAFLRFTLIYARVFSEAQRKIFEFLILSMALFSFVSLIYLHIVFVQSPVLCLEGYEKEWDQSKILRIEILRKNGMTNYTLYDSYYKEHAMRLFEAGLKPCPRIKYLQPEETGLNTSDSNVEEHPYKEKPVDVADLLNCRLNETDEETSIFGSVYEELSFVFGSFPNEDINIMEYSMEYGFLRLSPTMRNNLNISVLFVALDPDEDACIGGLFHKFLLDQFLGYDNLLLSSVKYIADKNNYKGYVRNIQKEIEYIFINDHGWLRSYLVAAIVMLVSTFSVSLLLRFSHQQIFVNIANLFELIGTHNRGRYNGSLLLTVILAFFGLQAIITSFFHHSTLTLNIMLIVWMADFYDSVCCRALMAKRHWYRFFLLYHFVFYAYNNRFNGLHWQLNLWTSWLFILHSMVFFFHHYELPYYVQSFVEFRETHHLRRREPPDISPLVLPNIFREARLAAAQSQEQQPGHPVPNSESLTSQQQPSSEASRGSAAESQTARGNCHCQHPVRCRSAHAVGPESSHAEISTGDLPNVKCQNESSGVDRSEKVSLENAEDSKTLDDSNQIQKENINMSETFKESGPTEPPLDGQSGHEESDSLEHFVQTSIVTRTEQNIEPVNLSPETSEHYSSGEIDLLSM